MSKRDIALYNLYLDLKRAATFYYLDPKGASHKVFLKHAQRIAKKLGKNVSNKINRLFDVISDASKEKIEIADEILTTGIILRSQI